MAAHCSICVVHLHLSRALGKANAVHEVANTALGDDVRGGVANLDGNHGASGETSLPVDRAHEHRHDEDNWVGAPGEDGGPACPLDLLAASLRLGLLGLLEANEEGVHDVAEWEHGEEPEAPPGAWVSGDLTRVAVENHEAGRDAEGSATLEGLLLGEAHDKDDLDEEQRDGKEPIDISVGIVERNAGGAVAVGLRVAGVVVNLAVGDLARSVRGVEGVEDTEVVVHGDEGHEASEAQGGTVALVEAGEAEEEEDGGGSHGGEAQGEGVVDDIILVWSERHHC